MEKIDLQTNIHSRIPLSMLHCPKMAGLGHLWAWAWACAPALQGNALLGRTAGVGKCGRWEAWYKDISCMALSRRSRYLPVKEDTLKLSYVFFQNHL